MIPTIISSLISLGAGTLAELVKQEGVEYIKHKFNIDLYNVDFKNQDHIQKLKDIEKDNQVEILRLILSDKSDARNTYLELNQLQHETWLSKNIVAILSIIIIFSGFGLIAMLIFINIDVSKKDIIMYILGMLSCMLIQVISYFFGNSNQNNNTSYNAKNDVESKGKK